jgi:MFS family permease
MATTTQRHHLHVSPAALDPGPVAAAATWSPDRALVVLLLAFGLLGLTIGSQAVLWAELMPIFGVSPGLFGSAQLVSPLISIALLVLGGQLSAWLGKRRMGLASIAFLGASALVLAAGGGLPGLVLALALLGFGNGLFETSMNGAALDWEHATGRRILNVLHATFSCGAVAGSLGAGWLLGSGIAASWVLRLSAVACMLVFISMLLVRFAPAYDSSTSVGPTASLRLVFSRRALMFLALICVLGAVGESVANLWSVVYLYQRGGGALLGGATFALLSGAMLIGRLGNVWVVGRFGDRVSLRASGAGLVLAATLLVIPGGLGLAIAGFGVLGLAVAGIVPTVLGAAARVAPGQTGVVAGAMLAAVYLSFTLSPPLIGWVAELGSLQIALAIVGLGGAATVWLAQHASRPSSGWGLARMALSECRPRSPGGPWPARALSAPPSRRPPAGRSR